MMALKDWIMARDFGSLSMREYIDTKVKGHRHEVIVQKPSGVNVWYTYINKNEENIIDKKFKTKGQAMKFAKSYMKKH